MAIDFLNTPEALFQVNKITSSSSDNINSLHSFLSNICTGKRVLLLGSAPNVALSRLKCDLTVCVNGSPSIAKKFGLSCDITVLAGFTTNMKKEISSKSMQLLNFCDLGHLVFISAGDTLDNARNVLDSHGSLFDSICELTPVERAVIIRCVCKKDLGLGARDDRVSNGIFAAILMLWAGASEIVFSGFSLHGGHEYMGETPRHHVNGDQVFFERLGKSGLITTTSFELSKTFGLVLEKSYLPIFYRVKRYFNL